MATRYMNDGWTEEEAQSLMDASREDNYVALLEALRKRIAVPIADPNVAARALASLSRRLTEVCHELRQARVDGEAEDDIERAGRIPDEPFDYSMT